MHFFYLMLLTSSNQTHGLSFRRTRDERPEKYSYSSVERDEVDTVWELFRTRHEELFTVSELHKARSQQLKVEMNEKTKSSMIYIGNTDKCIPYIDPVTHKTLSLEEKSLLKDVNLAMESRPMKSLRDFQKRKYRNSPSILGIQGERRNIDESNNSLDNLQQHISNIDEVNQVESASDATLEDNVPPLFSAGDLVVFRGTPGTPFEFLEVTDDAHQDNVKGTTKKIVGNFLILQDCNEFRALFFKHHKWAEGDTMFEYVMKDRNENIDMVNVTKFTNI